jgi:hypothetical protein
MRLAHSCSQCNHSNKMSALLYADRIEMAKKKGPEFELRCKQCGSNNLVHVDDVVAENDFTILIVAILSIAAGIFLTFFFWEKGFIATISFMLPVIAVGAIAKLERTKIKIFNFGKYDSKHVR